MAKRFGRRALVVLAGAGLTCMSGLSGAALTAKSSLPTYGASPDAARINDWNTVTPIKHVIVIIGENRSFDHVFATYVPPKGQTVHNLLSEGIIQLNSAKSAVAGPNFAKAQQLAAIDKGPADAFLLSPSTQDFP